MWTQFTPEARRAVLAAQIEAERECRLQVAPAHLLLAVLDCSPAPAGGETAGPAPGFAWHDSVSEETTASLLPLDDSIDETVAARVLDALGASPPLVRLAIQSRLRAAPKAAAKSRAGAKIKLSNASKSALQFAADEARRLRAHHIGTDHLLLGIARARFESMPYYFFLAWPLRRLNVISEAALLDLWRRSDPLHTVVAEVLAEFKLDLPALRLQAAATASDDPAAAPWTPEVHRAIERAQHEARATGAARVGAEHLWLGLLEEFDIAAAVQSAGIEVQALQKHLRAALLSDSETPGASVRFTAEARRALSQAKRFSATGEGRITPARLLAALAGATDNGGASALGRAQKALSAEPASRAAAAVAHALREAGLPEDHLRRHLLKQPRSRVAELRHADAVPRVTAIVAEHLNMPFNEVTAATPLMAADRSHLVTLDIFLHCAREFGITLAREDAQTIHTVSDLANAVVTKIVAKNSAPAAKPLEARVRPGGLSFIAYLLPFLLSLTIVIFIPVSLSLALFFLLVPVAIHRTSPNTRLGRDLSPLQRALFYGLGLFAIGAVAAITLV